MPELGEVEYFRRQWDAGMGRRVEEVRTHPKSRIFRQAPAPRVAAGLRGEILEESRAHGKQLLFRFSGGKWLGIHLGMTGQLRVEGAAGTLRPKDHIDLAQTRKHDHLVLQLEGAVALIFSDPRHFGAVRWDVGPEPPAWWRRLPPEIGTPGFTFSRMDQFLQKRARAPIKAVLLMQEGFPGVGNWMADEILWRSEIHPARRTGTLTPGEKRRLYKELGWVCRQALEWIGRRGREVPAGWLFHHRWKAGGRCPATGAPLARDTIAGRTTCWSPERQKLSTPTPRTRP